MGFNEIMVCLQEGMFDIGLVVIFIMVFKDIQIIYWCSDCMMVFLLVIWKLFVVIKLGWLMDKFMIFNDVMMQMYWFIMVWFVEVGENLCVCIELNYNEVMKSLVFVGYGVVILLLEQFLVVELECYKDLCIVLLFLVFKCYIGVVYCVLFNFDKVIVNVLEIIWQFQ